MDEKMKEKILKAIGMRAAGYETSESVEEYTVTDGETVLTRRKITTKSVPPDIAAAKLLFELMPDETANMTEEELRREKERLLRLLAESDAASGKGANGAGGKGKSAGGAGGAGGKGKSAGGRQGK